jgi:PKD repeat protein
MKKRYLFRWLVALCSLAVPYACSDDPTVDDPATEEETVLSPEFSTDKTSYLAGETVWFTNTSTVTGGTISAWQWDFGVTPDDDRLAIQKNPALVYTTPGVYSVKLTVSTLKGVTASVSHDIEVIRQNLAPVAAFEWSPEVAYVGDKLQFKDLSTDEINDLKSWSWNFGDGSDSEQQNPTHTYTDAGSYRVVLTVTDGEGLSASVEKIVEVNRQDIATALWSAKLAASGQLLGSSPAVGTTYVYAASTEGKLVAFNRTSGAEAWSFDLTSSGATEMSLIEGASPSVDPADGRVIIATGGSTGGNCRGYAIDGTTGQQAWYVAWPKVGSRIPWQAPVIMNDYIAVANRATGGSAYVWSKEGKKVVSSSISGIGGGMVARADNTVFYSGTGTNGCIAAVYANGAFTFAALENSIGYGTVSVNGSQPIIDSKGRIFMASGNAVYCYDTNSYDGTASATLLWSNTAVASNQICKGAGFALSADGQTLYGTSMAGELFALNADTGAKRWLVSTQGPCYCVPAVDNLGQIHVCDNNGNYAIYSSADGTQLFSIKLGDSCYSSPAIADDGTVFVSAEKEGACYLHAFRVDGVTSAADSDWAQFGQNQRHTGVQRTR